jgi:valyl-tRNA synthetase
MQDSVHRSPWPTIEEFAAIPAPKNPLTYAATAAVLEAVRKKKAEASLSMKAPVARVTITGAPEALDAVKATIDDIQRMLQIAQVDFVEGRPETGLVTVETFIES